MLRQAFLTVGALTMAMGFWACAEDSHQMTVERGVVGGLPTVVATETARATAKVEAVDYANRSIALRGKDDLTHIFWVTPAARNFEQIKKGDIVRVEYFSRVAASVHKTSVPPSAMVLDATRLAKLGAKPGITCTRTAQIDATVEAIDPGARIVRLKLATGGMLTLAADKALQNLDRVAIGDKVVFDYTEAVAISVD